MEENFEQPQEEMEEVTKEAWYEPLTKATPLSKLLALAIILSVPVFCFLVGQEYKKAQPPTPYLVTAQDEVFESPQSVYEVIEHEPIVYPELAYENDELDGFTYNNSLLIKKSDGTKVVLGLYELTAPALLEPPVNWPSGVDNLYLQINEVSNNNLVSGTIMRRLGQGDPPMYVGESEFLVDMTTGYVEFGEVTMNVNPTTGIPLDSYREEWEKEQEEIWSSFEVNLESETKADLIKVVLPKPSLVVNSPLLIEGEARGYWFFEASAPVVLVDWDGKIIAEGYVTADDDWMTEDFVPFTGTLEFTSPYKAGDESFMQNGTLIFKKANASGLPEHDDALEIPVRFQ